MEFILLAAVVLSLSWLGRELWRIGRAYQAARDQAAAPAKLANEVRKLERLEPGGTPENALSIPAPSVVEAHAGNRPCTRCEGGVEVVEHAVYVHDGERLRSASVRCRSCGHQRTLYFRLKQLS